MCEQTDQLFHNKLADKGTQEEQAVLRDMLWFTLDMGSMETLSFPQLCLPDLFVLLFNFSSI